MGSKLFKGLTYAVIFGLPNPLQLEYRENIIVKEIDKLPIDVVMQLYRDKISAEKKGDTQALMILEKHYPDLFSSEFDEFITNMQMCIEYIRHKYDEDFREILMPKKLIQH